MMVNRAGAILMASEVIEMKDNQEFTLALLSTDGDSSYSNYRKIEVRCWNSRRLCYTRSYVTMATTTKKPTAPLTDVII